MKNWLGSDRFFLSFSAACLVALGLTGLVLGLSCRIVEWGYCRINLVPLFGNWENVRQELSDLTAINMPLAMLALGFSLRLFTAFGWAITLLVLSTLTAFFSFLAYQIYQGSALLSSAGYVGTSGNLVVESMVTNLSFVFLCLLAISYILHPSIRKMYWS
ncbi:MAG: hypothetical protein AAF206_25385 [Bacteroidota bacterium]